MNLMTTRNSYRVHFFHIQFHKEMLYRIIQIGLPAGFQSLMYSLSNVYIQTNINQFGTNTIAAWTAYGKIDGLFWMVMGSFGISITTFVGQNYGAGMYERVRKGIRVCLLITMTSAVFMSVLFYAGGAYVFYLFTSDAAVIALGVNIMHFLVPFYFTYICIEILSGALRGMGDALIPMLLTCFGVCVFRIIWLFYAVPKWPEVRTVIVSYPITWATTSVLFILYYLITVKKRGIEK
jgi:Na+-driven multidrug efflux pump